MARVVRTVAGFEGLRRRVQRADAAPDDVTVVELATGGIVAGARRPSSDTPTHFRGPVPVTRRLRDEEIATDYEAHTGAVIVERYRLGGLDPMSLPGVLMARHGPFTWGESVDTALDGALALEAVARTALYTEWLRPTVAPVDEPLLKRHFERKHGPAAYYGQPPAPGGG